MPHYSTYSFTTSLYGSPQYVGTIAAGSATLKNNESTAAPFAIKAGHIYLLQGDQAHWFLAAVSQVSDGSGASNSTPSSSSGNGALATNGSNGVLKAANDEYIVFLQSKEDLLQAVGNGVTANIKVWELVPDPGN